MTAPPEPGASFTALPTERLYWPFPQDRHFTATVLAVRQRAVALDRTLFYPEGGGQASDAGTLRWDGGEAAVSDVQKDGETIWHTLDGQVPDIGHTVTGDLDWIRRYRHSQRHTAEHLLAQAFARINPVFAVRSVSMRGPECTLDLAGQPGEMHVQAAQELLQEALREGLTLETQVVPAAELHRYPLRRPPQVSGPVRAVLFRQASGDIWEASACGGTHLNEGGQAAPVVVLKTERVKGDLTRVTFMAGEEATERLSSVYALAQTLARSFSVPVERLPERTAQVEAELSVLQAEVQALRLTVAGQVLENTVWQSVPGGQLGVLTVADDALLPPLLELAALRPASVTVVAATSGRVGVASTLPLYAAATLLRAWLAQAGGRGGGRLELAQGQAERPKEFLAAAQRWADKLSVG